MAVEGLSGVVGGGGGSLDAMEESLLYLYAASGYDATPMMWNDHSDWRTWGGCIFAVRRQSDATIRASVKT